ncbi:MAG TPA: phosphoglycerate mutase family protein [Bryobacteraceae bacterium]|nr:phosphoglycerate mutase family protein [Bryobacteraceae bacterium]
MRLARAAITIRRLAALVLLAAWSSALAADPARTVILVRHAERAGGMSADVGISEAGRCRAESLARMLADAGVKRVFVTEVARTQQTAQPLADKLSLRPEVIPSKDIDGLVAKLRHGEPGGVALVVGHSNTLPEIISRMGGGTVRPIADDDYGNLFVVTLTAKSRVSVVRLRYAGCAQ